MRTVQPSLWMLWDRDGGKITRLFPFPQIKALKSCGSNTLINRSAKRRACIPDQACRQGAASLQQCAWAAREKKRSFHCCELQLPPVSAESRSSRASPVTSLRFVWCVKHWTASSLRFHHPEHPPVCTKLPKRRGAAGVNRLIRTEQPGRDTRLPIWKKRS